MKRNVLVPGYAGRDVIQCRARTPISDRGGSHGSRSRWDSRNDCRRDLGVPEPSVLVDLSCLAKSRNDKIPTKALYIIIDRITRTFRSQRMK